MEGGGYGLWFLFLNPTKPQANGMKQEGCIGLRGTRGYLLKYSRRRSMEDISYIASDKFIRLPF
jgi:hypothetical protein